MTQDINLEEISDVFYLEEFKKMSQQERSSLIKNLYLHLKSVYNVELSKAITCQDMFDGEQLPGALKQQLLLANREPFTCNTIKPACMSHVGNVEAEFQRPEFRYILPYQPDEKKSRIIKNINSIMSYWYDKANVKSALLDAYLNSIVQGRAQIQIVYTGGEICLEVGTAISCMLDPNTTKTDLSDCSFILEVRNISKDFLISKYPESASKINQAGLMVDERNQQQTMQPLPQGMCTLYTLHTKTYDYISSNGKFGDTVVINILATSNEVLSAEKPSHSVFGWVLVAPKINKTFTNSGRKFLGLVEDVVAYQNMINKGLLSITNKIHTSMVDGILYLPECLENPDIFDTALNLAVAVKNIDDPQKAVTRIQSSDLPPVAIEYLKSCSDEIYFRLGANPPSLQEKSNEVVTASLMEMKNRNSSRVNGYSKHQLETSHKALVFKLVKMVLEVAITEERKTLEMQKNLGTPTNQKCINISKLSDVCGEQLTAEDIMEMEDALEDCTVMFMNAHDSTSSRERTLQGIQMLTQLGIPVDHNYIIDALQMPQSETLKKYAGDIIKQNLEYDQLKKSFEIMDHSVQTVQTTNAMKQQKEAEDLGIPMEQQQGAENEERPKE